MLEFADIIGIIAFAISGFIIGAREKLDILGIAICSFLTALGGGITRDVLAGKSIYAFNDSLAPILVLLVIITGIYMKFHKYDVEHRSIFIISDSIGLVSFSISGAIVGIDAGFNIFGVIMLSVITAVGGGMMRDVLINKIPFVLKENFYATVSVLVGFLVYFFGKNDFVLIVIFIFGLLLRLIAHKKSWNLPKI
jgi:uncharacterized membrane protein YeiH